MAPQVETKSLHWRYAMLTAIRLRNMGALVENDVLEALKITLLSPSSPETASPGLLNSIRSLISEDDEVETRKDYLEYVRKNHPSQIHIGAWSCRYMLRVYERMSDRRNMNGYYVDDNHYLNTPSMGPRGGSYRVEIRTSFTVQYARGVPHRMCAIAQSRHPGDWTLSGLEVISIVLLAIECYKNAPNEPFQTVRVFAVDSFLVRRLSARIPSTYIRCLLHSTENAAPDELDGEISVEQTPYFDISNAQGLEEIVAVLLEDEGLRVPEDEAKEAGSVDTDSYWAPSPELGPDLDKYW
ncbi:hypothetical protein MMC22_004632 [Lobaria immixta]|nr:hypothetical protein [Lobaria immixta]